MIYKELGKTGMKISHLSFGASSLGSVFRETNEKESFEAVEAAIEGGINFIDVSPYMLLTGNEKPIDSSDEELLLSYFRELNDKDKGIILGEAKLLSKKDK